MQIFYASQLSELKQEKILCSSEMLAKIRKYAFMFSFHTFFIFKVNINKFGSLIYTTEKNDHRKKDYRKKCIYFATRNHFLQFPYLTWNHPIHSEHHKFICITSFGLQFYNTNLGDAFPCTFCRYIEPYFIGTKYAIASCHIFKIN